MRGWISASITETMNQSLEMLPIWPLTAVTALCGCCLASTERLCPNSSAATSLPNLPATSRMTISTCRYWISATPTISWRLPRCVTATLVLTKSSCWGMLDRLTRKSSVSSVLSIFLFWWICLCSLFTYRWMYYYSNIISFMKTLGEDTLPFMDILIYCCSCKHSL